MRATSGGGRPCTSVLPSPRPARKSAPTTSGIRSGGLARRGGALRGRYRDASPDRACRQALCRQWLLGGPAGTGRSPRRTDPGSGPTQYAMASRSRVRGAFAEWAVARPRRRALAEANFATDSSGTPLPRPVSLLLSSTWDLTGAARVFTRDDATGVWSAVTIMGECHRFLRVRAAEGPRVIPRGQHVQSGRRL